MNRKGFTLVELLATLVILGIIVSIGSVSITKTIKNNKIKNYETVITNIKKASELFYQECKYGDYFQGFESLKNICSTEEIEISLGFLIEHGYLKANALGNKLVNPLSEYEIQDCEIEIKWDYIELKVSPITAGKCPVDNLNEGTCPCDNHYDGDFSDL